MDPYPIQHDHSPNLLAPTKRKRSFWRGLVAGVTVHYLVLLGLILVLWVVRPFIWATVYGVPYVAPKGPMDPNTNEWLIVQAIYLLSWIVAGAATARWSKPRSWAPLTLLIIFCAILIFMEPKPGPTSVLRLTLWFLEVPLGLLCGQLLYMHREREVNRMHADG